MRPYITIKFAETLDGKIAAPDGSSKWISGPESRKFAHKLRSKNDAVLIGVGTLLSDNPSLTTRLVKGKNPCRIIVDRKLCIPLNSKIVKDASKVRTIVIAGNPSKIKKELLLKKGVEVILFPSKSGSTDMKKLACALYRKGIKRLLVEGGKGVITSFIKAGIVDKIIAVISPKILGNGLSPVGDLGISGIKGALNLRLESVKRLGGDVVITVRLNHSYTLRKWKCARGNRLG